MANLFQSRTLTVAIARDPDVVFAYVSQPANLPHWAPSFCKSIRHANAQTREDRWILTTADGEVVFYFLPTNTLGILDHVVMIAPGLEVHVPMRVVPNGDGSEFMLTIFQQPNMTQEAFERDIAFIERDLRTLKTLMEKHR